MKCPTCTSEDLKLTERSGVEIDYCPKCRGVWLDRGELDKLIDRAAEIVPPPPVAGRRYDVDDDDDDDRRPYTSGPGGQRYGQGRKKSFWRDMFDFD